MRARVWEQLDGAGLKKRCRLGLTSASVGSRMSMFYLILDPQLAVLDSRFDSSAIVHRLSTRYCMFDVALLDEPAACFQEA